MVVEQIIHGLYSIHINFIELFLKCDIQNPISNLYPALFHLPLFFYEVDETVLVHNFLQKGSPLGYFLLWCYLFVPALTLASCRPLYILYRYIFVKIKYYIYQTTLSSLIQAQYEHRCCNMCKGVLITRYSLHEGHTINDSS